MAPHRALSPSAYLPHVGQAWLELFPGVLGVADVHQLPLDGGGGIKRYLLAPVHTGHCGPDADGTPEVFGDIGRDHVLHTDVKVLGAVDLEAEAHTMCSLGVGRASRHESQNPM